MISVSKQKQEEILWKKAVDASEDRRNYVYDLWERQGIELIIRLDMMNLSVIDTNTPGELLFCHIRYRKDDKLHSKWLTKWKEHKKWNIISTHLWSFYPIRIYCKTQSIEPKNQKYVFLVRYAIIEDNKEKSSYTGRIEAASDGSILEWSPENECDPLPLLPKFPKSMLAKINRCLANNFLPDLWMGCSYAKWHRTDEGISRYMLTYSGKKKPYIEPLLALLRSDCGSAAVILLAFTCFSVAKPFFPQYRSLV